MELEGLRGVAAIVVVMYHSMIMFYPGIAYGNNPILAPVHNLRLEEKLYGNPINVFLSGGFAVAIFFALSGFVLSIGYFQTGNESIVQRLASKRYLRLMLPALASCILAYLLLSFGLAANKQVTVDIAHSGSLSSVWNFVPHLFDAVKEGLLTNFLQSGGRYNAVLWTMYYEFMGSFIVFITLLIFGKSKFRWVVYCAAIVATFGTWFLGIILGMIFADLYSQKSSVLKFLAEKRIVAWGVLGVGLLLGGYPILSPKGTFYEVFDFTSLSDGQNASMYLSIGALLVVVAVLYIPLAANFLKHPKISILGRYTYALYLTHTLVLYTLGTTLFVIFSRHFGINRSALFAISSSVPIIILVTWLFEKYVDAPSIKLANSFSDITLGRRELNLHMKENVLVFRSYYNNFLLLLRNDWNGWSGHEESEADELQ